MRIGVPIEHPGQPLVAATPETVTKLRKLGYSVVVEAGAGEESSYPDYQYEEAGATIVGRDAIYESDIVLALDTPTDEEVAGLRPGLVLVSRLAPARNPQLLDKLAEADITALAMDTVPRISRAQAMDVLSSQANVAGYRAVIEAADKFGRLFAGQVTAAGKMPPANVYVIGAGVAGLAAIGTAGSLGAEVYATDVRSEVAEQIESMGARFVPLPTVEQKSDDGYAKAMDADQAALARKAYAKQAAASDIVITTANIPGAKAPILLDDAAIAAMRPGSVIVDMAAGNGGNTTQTIAGEKVVTSNGVTIIGFTDLAGRLPAQSSQLYAQNIVNLLQLMTPNKDGELVIDLDDEIVRTITVTLDREVLWPPPPIVVSATPTPVAEEPDPAEHAARVAAAAKEAALKKQRRFMWLGLAAVLVAALVLVTPFSVVGNYWIFGLAIIVGFYVITNVTH